MIDQLNMQVLDVQGEDVTLLCHPESGEPRPGEILHLVEGEDSGFLVQALGLGSARYPGDAESAQLELMQTAVARRLEVVPGEPGLADQRSLKLLKAKLLKRTNGAQWESAAGSIPSRNAHVEKVAPEALLAHVTPASPQFPLGVCRIEKEPVAFDAAGLGKVAAIVGPKGTGKSHSGKHLVAGLSKHGAACLVFDMNREFVGLPGAETIQIGHNHRLSLTEVGFDVLVAIIDAVNPLTDVSRGAFESEGRRKMKAEQDRHKGFATVGYLLERAEANEFHGGNDAVNRAIEARLRMIVGLGLFSDNPEAETFADIFDRVVDQKGFVVLDLTAQPLRGMKAIVRGLLRWISAYSLEEAATGRCRFPFLFADEAHFYLDKEEILNLVTRSRHLGISSVFMTNSPGQMPVDVFRMLDNLVVTGALHTADQRTVGMCDLCDEETIEALARALRPHEALVIGALTTEFPLVVTMDSLPDHYPETGQTKSFWEAASAAPAQAGSRSKPQPEKSQGVRKGSRSRARKRAK